jgi:alkylation response protein AidB-like acyl-CoA dehydrogenase
MFDLTEEQRAIRDSAARIMRRFDDAYWLERDRLGEFPHAFFAAMAEAGFLGIAMPEAYGGAGLGISEAAVLMMTVTDSAGAMAAQVLRCDQSRAEQTLHPSPFPGIGQHESSWLVSTVHYDTQTS